MFEKKFIDGNLEIWDNSRIIDAPLILQPFNPVDGSKWSNEKAAFSWADEFIVELEQAKLSAQPASTDEGTSEITAEIVE